MILINTMRRIAVINPDLCKPQKCNQECRKSCPVNKSGKMCIEVTPSSKISSLSETLCIGCSMCVKACPFNAIKVINLPVSLDKLTTHRYGSNGFKLHRLPLPRQGKVLGIIGANGTGKSTILKILSGIIQPNLGIHGLGGEPQWVDIIKYFRGSELQNYFAKIASKELRISIKPQHINISQNNRMSNILNSNRFVDDLGLTSIMGKNISELSGGESQRYAICHAAQKPADVYMFDEPSSFLDVKQRINAAKVIMSLCCTETYVITVEHDLSIADYMSDIICVVYGTPGAYGVVTLPYGVREGINVFLEGFIPTENMRFRDSSLQFHTKDQSEIFDEHTPNILSHYPQMLFNRGDNNFSLQVEPGYFSESEITVLMGENGTGKTTFIKLIAGLLKPTNNVEVPELFISYKPQIISPVFDGTVRNLLLSKGLFSMTSQFISDVYNPLKIEDILDFTVKNLSGGELQRIALVLCLAKPADVYLIDEPSAYLDSEQRMLCSRAIKRFIYNSKKTAFVIEHDFIMSTYLADKIIYFSGIPSYNCVAHSSCSVIEGVNSFLRDLDITFRRDELNLRPRINKLGSVKDREQKSSGNYFFTEDI
jgi:ATP-binding cassette subfamily E protein 1